MSDSVVSLTLHCSNASPPTPIPLSLHSPQTPKPSSAPLLPPSPPSSPSPSPSPPPPSPRHQNLQLRRVPRRRNPPGKPHPQGQRIRRRSPPPQLDRARVGPLGGNPHSGGRFRAQEPQRRRRGPSQNTRSHRSVQDAET